MTWTGADPVYLSLAMIIKLVMCCKRFNNLL